LAIEHFWNLNCLKSSQTDQFELVLKLLSNFKTFFVKKLHFSVIYGGFYKITEFKPRSIDPFFKIAPRVLQLGPSKEVDLHICALGGSGELADGRARLGE
jgi:hypothetical protein